MNAWVKISLVMLCAILVSMFCAPLQADAATYYLQGDTTTSLGFDGTANLPTTQTTGTTIPYRGTMVASPVSATSLWTLRSVKAEINAVAMVIPALGPSLGTAPSGTWI